MLRRKSNGIEWLEFEQLANIPHLKHGVFLRSGGISTGEFASLNLSESVGDQLEHVLNNKQKIKDALHITDLKGSKQCHGIQVNAVSCGPCEQLLVGDALVTSDKHVGLMINHADCQAAIFYDPRNHVVANVHSGWRGNVQNIYAETIRNLQQLYGSKPTDLLVCISPSLGPDNAQFVNYKTEFPESFWAFQTKPNYFDLWAISQMQLIECGIKDNHIEIAGIDTVANSADYFSYRRNNITGRNGTVVVFG